MFVIQHFFRSLLQEWVRRFLFRRTSIPIGEECCCLHGLTLSALSLKGLIRIMISTFLKFGMLFPVFGTRNCLTHTLFIFHCKKSFLLSYVVFLKNRQCLSSTLSFIIDLESFVQS